MRLFLPLLLLFFSLQLVSQQIAKVNLSAGEVLPAWAEKMYADNPNIWLVDDEYRKWRRTNPDAKTTYTQYYKKWRRSIEPFINNQGFVQKPTHEEKQAFYQRLEDLKSKNAAFYADRNFGWSVMGPIETFNTNTGPSPLAKSSQANIYCIDQSLSHPEIIYCGTEGAEIFKSTDKGQNWECISRTMDIGAVGAIEVHPTNPDIVFMGEDNSIWRSLDGGANWEMVLTNPNMWTNEILLNPANDSIVMAATFAGLFRSIDKGSNWELIFPEASYDIEWQPYHPEVAFLVKNNPALGICSFFKSTDAGKTWELKNNGWFFSDLEGRYDGGARLAVTNADSNRIYAVLIGEAKTDDSGFIGIYRSDDAGETWYLPNGPAGGPWNETDHPNMATIGRTGGYHQGFYNLGFDASDSNPDELLAGFLSLWKSTDGAYSFSCFGGYCHNDFNYVHPDCQEIEINGEDVWMTSDGGIEYSNDFFATHYARNRGITSSDYWGFGTGWNEDILVGGRYHNGNSGWHENWMPGEYLSLGGGEAATGYVNPGEGRKTYFSDIGGVVLPESQNGYAQYFSLGKYPNESYYDAESGEIEFYPLSWNTIFVTHENKIWKTEDGGASWNILHEFGGDPNARAMSFEISRSNPQVMYLFQRDEYSWDPGLLFKTINGGVNWDTISLPSGYARRALLAIHPENENILWLAYPDGNDGEKIFKTINGGLQWDNLTTPNLDGEHITYILRQSGSDGIIYLGTFRTVWWLGDSQNDWLPYNDGLPKQISTCILRPFYRDGKLRLGAYGKGIWEAAFAHSTDPVPQPMANKLITSCPGDTIHFDDYSMVDHSNAEWHWYFEGGTPSESAERNPKVVYEQPGEYRVQLSILYNGDQLTLKNVPGMIKVLEPQINSIPPVIDFSDTLHFTINNPDNGITWKPVVLNTCNTEGDTVYFVDNYNYSSYGQDEIVMPLNLDLTKIENAILKFNVAYAPYYDGNAFIDSLKVLISNNCGTTFRELFKSGGEALSTTSSGEGPNNLYEYNVFSPASCEEWRTVELDLSEYEGQYVTIKFLNKSGYGNQMYLDDIVIEGNIISSNTDPEDFAISVSPNPASEKFAITGEIKAGDPVEITLISPSGVIVFSKYFNPSSGKLSETISIKDFPNGIYFLTVKDSRGVIMNDKIVKQ